MVTIKSVEEIDILRQGGHKLAEILDMVIAKVKPGISTGELDQYAEELIIKAGGRPAFKGYSGFSGTLCTSVNEAVVHGVPSLKQILKAGDIIGLDIGMQWPVLTKATMGKARQKGLYTDMARTVPVGQVADEMHRLIEITEKSFFRGIEAIKPGARIGDIGCFIQPFVEKYGYAVVRSLSGHGVGYRVHEDPIIPNYGKCGQGTILRPGMVLAIEPMVCMGGYELETLADGWTAVTKDRKWAAHYENTVVVTDKGAEILTLS